MPIEGAAQEGNGEERSTSHRLPRSIRTMRKVVWGALLVWLVLVVLVVLLIRFS